METKICEKCKIEKPIDDFDYLMKNQKLKNEYCKSCFQKIKKGKVSQRFEKEIVNSLRYQSEVQKTWDMVQPLVETQRMRDTFREMDETQKIWDMIQPSGETQKMMDKIDETQKIWDKIKPSNEIQRVMDTLKESSEIQRMMDKMDETQKIWDMIQPPVGIQNLMNEIKTNKQIFDKIDIQNDGSISFEGYNVKNEVNYIFNIYLKDILYDTNNSEKELNKYPDKIKYIIVKSIKHIYDKYFVYIIRTILIIMALNIFYDNQMLSEISKFSSNKEINNYYVNNQHIVLNENESLSDYKFVTKNNLKIYNKPKNTKQILGILTIGQLVKIIDKNKKYTLIEYQDRNTEEIIKGWVLTKNIQRIKY